TEALNNVTPTLVVDRPDAATHLAGPTPGSTSGLQPGATASFTYTFDAALPAQVTATVGMAGVGAASSMPATAESVNRVFRTGSGQLGLTLTANPSIPSPGAAFAVTATITNGDPVSLTNVAPSPALTATPATGVVIGAPLPPSIPVLNAGGTATITWSVTAAN